MKKRIFIFAFLLIAMPSHAETLKQGHTGCFTKHDYKEMHSLVARGDIDGFKFMVTSGKCFISKAGMKISVLDSTWKGSKKVRAYVGDQSGGRSKLRSLQTSME